MKKNLTPVVAILGLGALAFMLGKKSSTSNTVTAGAKAPQQGASNVRVTPISASELAGYPAAEATGDVSDQPVATNIKLKSVKLSNGGAG